MKDREKLLTHLLSLREMRLREEVATLKVHAATLEDIDRALGAARDSASEAIASATDLRDLGLIGEVRSASLARAHTTKLQMREASERVTVAHQRAEAMRSAKAEVVQARELKQERSQDHDNEQFQAWKRGLEPRR